jgi:cytochrome c oxidase subunit 3
LPETAASQPDETTQRYHTPLRHQFDTLDQQHHADTLGMWLFLATEVLFFGGVIVAYLMMRHLYLQTFDQASKHLEIVPGTLMTIILLGSSLTVALGVHAAQTGRRIKLMVMLVLTLILGVAFLALKFMEYYHKWEDHLIPGAGFAWEGPDRRAAELFIYFYFALTGLHALHMCIGIGIFSTLLWWTWRRRVRSYTVEMSGLYWHFVDIVWIYLFPLLYLADRHK